MVFFVQIGGTKQNHLTLILECIQITAWTRSLNHQNNNQYGSAIMISIYLSFPGTHVCYQIMCVAMLTKFNLYGTIKIDNRNGVLLDAKMKMVSSSREDRVNLG